MRGVGCCTKYENLGCDTTVGVSSPTVQTKTNLLLCNTLVPPLLASRAERGYMYCSECRGCGGATRRRRERNSNKGMKFVLHVSWPGDTRYFFPRALYLPAPLLPVALQHHVPYTRCVSRPVGLSRDSYCNSYTQRGKVSRAWWTCGHGR